MAEDPKTAKDSEVSEEIEDAGIVKDSEDTRIVSKNVGHFLLITAPDPFHFDCLFMHIYPLSGCNGVQSTLFWLNRVGKSPKIMTHTSHRNT